MPSETSHWKKLYNAQFNFFVLILFGEGGGEGSEQKVTVELEKTVRPDGYVHSLDCVDVSTGVYIYPSLPNCKL